MQQHSDETEPFNPPGGRSTGREIRQQPEVWRKAAAMIAEQRTRSTAFLDPILAGSALRIVLTGAGTSAFIGGVAAPALSRTLTRRVEAIATTDLVSNPRDFLAEDVPTLLVSFARSGNSPESVAAADLADELLTEVHHLVITCDEQGALARQHADRARSLVVLMPPAANDAGFAMTSSFTSMLLSSLMLLGGLASSSIETVADATTGLLESLTPRIRALTTMATERVVYLGDGPLAALAEESALKLLELTAGRIVSYHDSSLGFRHGPKSVLTDSTLVFLYVSADPHARRYDLDMLAELRGALPVGRVIAVASAPVGDEAHEDDWVLPGLGGVEDAVLAVAYVVVAQLFALGVSAGLGFQPDNPFPQGGVSRVVQGVRIHPLRELR